MQIYVNLHIQTSLMQTEVVRDWQKSGYFGSRQGLSWFDHY